ncbi:hypothetical protein [Brucella cytisi]|uniref:hypothetical protein n=1 Tax=Brucella cytisi TaxID=407152 RepID=UPI0016A8AD57|nr:hypothetical protein [Brucella cytisi]
MIVRQAFFEGAIHVGREDAFKAYVADTLMPMWLEFPGIREVRVLYAVERDGGAPAYPMVLWTMYDSEEALTEALASPVRYESREATKVLLEMFDGHIHHHVFDLTLRG